MQKTFIASTTVIADKRSNRFRRTGSRRRHDEEPLLAEVLLEELRRPAPRQFRGLAIVHGLPLLVDEGVLGVVPEKLERFSGGLHRLLETIDRLRRAPVVLVGEMGLQRDFDVGGLAACSGGMP